MNEILSDKEIYYKSGYKYQLTRDRHFILPELAGCKVHYDGKFLSLHGNHLITRHGYAWDGASGPTWDLPSSMRGSLVHDALYQLMRMGVLGQEWRPATDKAFNRICKEDGMWEWRADGWHWAVWNFASWAAKKGTEREELCAP